MPEEAGSPVERLPDWAASGAVTALVRALDAAGVEHRFVGGCVRDWLAGRPVRDIDLSSPAAPERVMAALEAAGLGAVPTGLAHGTVTAVVEHRPFEITTLRHDVETDGRRAKVAFVDDWRQDAARRDLTINALSLAPDRGGGGRLFDYFGGRADLAAGRVRFVGDPARRIAEDRLRLLRFFRFHAGYGRGAPDPEALAAARAAAPELAKLSAERLRAELLALLALPDPRATLAVMAENAILAAVLPEATRLDRVSALIAQMPKERPDPFLRLTAWLDLVPESPQGIAERLRLSRAERDRLGKLAAPEALSDARPLAERLYRDGQATTRDRHLLSTAETGNPPDPAVLAEIAAWQRPEFPLAGRDLVALGATPGPTLGRLLSNLEDLWIGAGFAPDRDALLAEARKRLT